MKEANRKKLATIKNKILEGQYRNLGALGKMNGKADKEYAEALSILGKAIIQIERTYGDLD